MLFLSANLGGIFGLCLGGSMISIIELVWFVFDLLYSIIVVWRKTAVVPDKRRNDIFTVTNKGLAVRTRTGKINGKFKFVH